MADRPTTSASIHPGHPNVIVIKFERGNQWPEIFAAFDREKELVKQLGSPVGVIMDIRDAPDPPDNTTLGKATQLFRGQPFNVQLWVLCGGSGFSKVIATIMRNAGLVRMEFAPTIEEAFSLIESRLKT